jgi:hypothetical protein
MASDFAKRGAGLNVRTTDRQTALLKLSKADLWRIRSLEIEFSEYGSTFPKDLEKWIKKWLVALFAGVRELNVLWVWGFGTIGGLRAGARDKETIRRFVKGEVDSAMEMARSALEEIERQRGGGWKAPSFNISSLEGLHTT